MSDESLTKALRGHALRLEGAVGNSTIRDLRLAANRIEALTIALNDSRQLAHMIDNLMVEAVTRTEKLESALQGIAEDASVRVHTKKGGGINHKKMYKGWRKIAVERIDMARAALAEDEE